MSRTLKIENGDVVRSLTKEQYTFINGKDKAIQDTAMILSTDIRSDTGDGCGLDKVIGTRVDRRGFAYMQGSIVLNFQMRIQSGLNKFIKSQRSYLYSQRTKDELIQEIGPVQVWKIPDDPRHFRWRVDIITVDGGSNFYIAGRSA